MELVLPETTIEFAPAKININLHVTGRREDGYHLLDSLVVFANVGDDISVSISDSDRLTVKGPFASGLDAGSGNLVAKAQTRWWFQARQVPFNLCAHDIRRYQGL